MNNKSKLKKFLVPGMLVGAGVLATVPVVTVLSSCTSTQSKSVVVVENKQYTSNEDQYLTGSNYSYPTYTATTSYATLPATQASIQSLYNNAKAAKAALEKITTTNLSTNEKIWLESYETQWDIKIKNIENGLVYLGANPMKAGSRILSSRDNSVATNLKDAINIYDLNDETGDPDTTKPNSDLIKNINTKIDEAITFIKSLQGFLSDGMQLGIMPSNLTKKSFIKQTLQFFYQDEIGAKLTSTTTSIKVTDLFKASATSAANTSLTYLTTTFAETYKAAAKNIGFTNSSIDNKLQELTSTLNDFMYFYCGAYYTTSNYYGGTNTELTLSKTNATTNGEVEQTLSLTDGSSVYGVGYTDADLKTPNIGLGFMNITADAKNINNANYVGNNIYDQMLYSNNSIDTDAETIYKNGSELTTAGTTKMKSIANQVITNILNKTTDNFSETSINYTSDPFSVAPTEKTIKKIMEDSSSTQNDYFTQFNIWLNQEDFFFGRETSYTDLVNKYWTNADKDTTLAKYKNIIITQGYQTPWENQANIDGSKVTVSGNRALAGAVSSLESYMQFKDGTKSLYDSYFNPIADYVLSPYNYDIREDIGVGMEGPRGSKQFQYNADPYYSLQKWSVASLTTHEGAMGHHTQQEYWTEYMQGTKNGVVTNENATPGYTFTNDAYHEGWAVFMEWFASEIGTYGTWGSNTVFDGTVLPTNWLTTTSDMLTIADENNPTETEINFIKNYQGGVYYNLVNGVSTSTDTDATKAVKATKLANMLAYYGFLNESQLRNMRMALDTAVHHKSTNTNTGSTDASTSLPFGASIKQERDYMKANSGLGAGDIASESIRYASMPSQATGYMLGKTIFNGLYTAVKEKVTTENKTTNANYNFAVDDKATIKKLFDLMLRNGEIPLQVMIDFVNSEFGIKYSPSTTTNNK